jgi:serine/threonine protein kinase
MNATLLQTPTSSVSVNSDCSKLAGRYQIIEQLGEGGFAETYLALDTYLPDGYQCVVKKLKVPTSNDLQQFTARRLFIQEAAALHQLGDHPQIPKLLAHFQQGEDCYLVEEYIEGYSLSQELQPGKIWDTWAVLHLIQDLLNILTYVHHHHGGYIHRDIKPSNLIRRKSDQKLVLIDFGSVKPVAENHSAQSALDVMGQTVIVGTIGYMPSEQLRGNPRRSSDLYAVGMLALYALTGMNPAFSIFPEDEQTGTLKWREYANIASDLAAIIDRLISNDLSERYASAGEALNAIQSLITAYQYSTPTIIKALPPHTDIVIAPPTTNFPSTSNLEQPRISSQLSLSPTPSELPAPAIQSSKRIKTLLPFRRSRRQALQQQIQSAIGFRTQLIWVVIGILASVTTFHHLPWNLPENPNPPIPQSPQSNP